MAEGLFFFQPAGYGANHSSLSAPAAPVNSEPPPDDPGGDLSTATYRVTFNGDRRVTSDGARIVTLGDD